MSRHPPAEGIVLGVGAVIWNERNEVLLVRRANPPRRNEWSLPGGKVEYGETLRAALIREVQEETGLAIEIVGLIDVAELVLDAAAGAAGKHYVLVDFCARALPGHAAAASDAAEVRWFTLAEIEPMPLCSETRRIIREGATLIGRSEKTASC
jgi:8-oxo-dGTP diphosphatase